MNIIIALFSFVLVLLCLFTLLVVMVQKPKGDGGMGAALGGGSMEAALGAETGSLLTKITIYAVIGFFVLTFALYLGNLASKKGDELEGEDGLLSEMVEETPAPGTSTDVSSETALQQLLQVGEEAAQKKAADGSNAAADMVEEAEAAAEGLKAETEAPKIP